MRANVNLLTSASQSNIEISITGYENSTAAHVSGDWGAHNQFLFYATPFAEFDSGDTIANGFLLRTMLTGTNTDIDGFSIGTGDAAFTMPAILTGTIIPGTGGIPYIIRQPQSISVFVGQIATFTVKAISAVPMTYQWNFNGTNISGATDSIFNIGSAALTDQAQYNVDVTNEFGSVASNVATLTVQPLSAAFNVRQRSRGGFFDNFWRFLPVILAPTPEIAITGVTAIVVEEEIED